MFIYIAIDETMVDKIGLTLFRNNICTWRSNVCSLRRNTPLFILQTDEYRGRPRIFKLIHNEGAY